LGRAGDVRAADTSADAQEIQDELYRRMGGRERVAIQFRLSAAARALTLAGIRQRHPEYDDERARMALARVILGDELTQKAWPDRPLVEP